jgi:hypothetical protein
LLELIGFLLPALPPQLWMRLLILAVYFIAHMYGLQYRYKHMKTEYRSRYSEAGSK